MAEDLRLAFGFASHWKTKMLERRVPGAVLALIKLWTYVAQCPDRRLTGSLEGVSEAELECLVDWPGEPGTMLATLIDLRLVDERPLALHDWADHQPYLTGAVDRSEQARRAAQARWTERKRLSSPKLCGEHAGSMLAACGEHAGSMLAACGEHAGSMQPAMLIDAPPSLPTSQPPDPLPPDPRSIKENPIMPRRAAASAPGRPPARASPDPRERRQGSSTRETMDPRLLAEAQARLAMPEGELSAVLERQARLAREARESLEASRRSRLAPEAPRQAPEEAPPDDDLAWLLTPSAGGHSSGVEAPLGPVM